MYVYELTAFEYSDFSYWLLSHEKKYSEEEFKAIVREADSKIKKNCHEWGYINDLISILGQQYGFKSVEPVTCYVYGYDGSHLNNF